MECVIKRPWSKPGPEGRKGVIAFSRTQYKVFFGFLRGVIKEFLVFFDGIFHRILRYFD
jgi:hypothetical protein